RAVPPHLILGWLTAGLAVRLADQRLAITSSGQAHLKRALHDLNSQPDSHYDPYGAQHRDVHAVEITLPDRTRQMAMANLAESPLAWLYRRKSKNGQRLLSDTQFQAGERLRLDYERGQLRQRISSNWEASLASGGRGAARGGDDLSDAAMDARARVQKALQSLTVGHAGIVEDVCCHLKTITDIERERNWPRRAGRIVLAMALDELGRHYGLVAAAKSPRSNGAIRAWGDGEHIPTRALPE
ncbi:MAG: DUF6456 domain-containing protein, partial [Pseudomonadota bacterium]